MTAAALEHLENIPGPAGAPLLGSFLQVAGDRLAFFTRLRERYGRTVAFRVAGRRFVLLTEPEDVMRVLGEHESKYRKGVGQHEVRAVLGDGLLTSIGEEWDDRHRRLVPLFRRAPADRAAEEIERIAVDAGEEWRSRGRVDLVHELAIVALRVAGALLLGVDLREKSARMAGLFSAFERRAMTALIAGLLTPRAITERLPKLLVAPYRRRLIDAMGGIDLRSTPVGAVFDGCPDSAIEEEVLTLLWAGHDTSAAAMASALAEIIARPELHGAIVHELSQSRTSPLLTRSIQETLRLHPPVWLIPRYSLTSDTLATCSIVPDTYVMICTYVLHRDPQLWSRPDEFLPSRFERAAHGGAFLPFGTGPRRCIGSGMALTEMNIVLSTLLRRLAFTRRGTVRYTTMLTLRPRRLMTEVR